MGQVRRIISRSVARATNRLTARHTLATSVRVSLVRLCPNVRTHRDDARRRSVTTPVRAVGRDIDADDHARVYHAREPNKSANLLKLADGRRKGAR